MFTLYEYEEASSSSKDITFFSPPNVCHHVHIQAYGGVIRYTLDGSTPTASRGLRLLPTKGKRYLLEEDFRKIKFVREAGMATLHVHYSASNAYGLVLPDPPTPVLAGDWIWDDDAPHYWDDDSPATWD